MKLLACGGTPPVRRRSCRDPPGLAGIPPYLAEKNGFPALSSESRGFHQICLGLYFIYNVRISELWEYDLPK